MVLVFLVLSKESNAYVYYTDCEHRAHIYEQFVLNISHCFDLNEIFFFFVCFRFSQHQRLVCINVYISFLVTRISKVIYCRLSFWQLHLQSLDQTRQKRKSVLALKKPKLAARRLRLQKPFERERFFNDPRKAKRKWTQNGKALALPH